MLFIFFKINPFSFAQITERHLNNGVLMFEAAFIQLYPVLM